MSKNNQRNFYNKKNIFWRENAKKNWLISEILLSQKRAFFFSVKCFDLKNPRLEIFLR